MRRSSRKKIDPATESTSQRALSSSSRFAPEILENLYPDKPPRLSFQQLNLVVKEYQEAEGKRKQELREYLLKVHHNYITKYVCLLKGVLTKFNSGDTRAFLNMFLANRSKTLPNYIFVAKQLAQVFARYEPMDIYNELCIIFLHLLDKFEFRGNVSFSQYICLYMRWDIKVWILKTFRNPLNQNLAKLDSSYLESVLTSIKEEEKEEEKADFEISMAWVCDPQNPTFEVLTPYERMLIFLRFKEGMRARSIGQKFGRAKDTIRTHLKQALKKLESALKAQED